MIKVYTWRGLIHTVTQDDEHIPYEVIDMEKDNVIECASCNTPLLDEDLIGTTCRRCGGEAE